MAVGLFLAVTGMGPASAPSPARTSVTGEAPPAIALPGTLQAEDFNDGGEGVGYHDTTPGNNGMSTLRDPSDVDIKTATQCGGGRTTPCVGWLATGEWLAYDVEVAEDGVYTFTLVIASNLDTGLLHFEVDGVAVTEMTAVPMTGGWDVWTELLITGVELTAGSHVLRLVVDMEFFDFDEMVVALEAPMCGNGKPDAGEECDGEACCTASCAFAAAGTECRASTGPSDPAESCTGAAATCPPDAMDDGGVSDAGSTSSDAGTVAPVDAGRADDDAGDRDPTLQPHGSGLLCSASRGGAGVPADGTSLPPALAVALVVVGFVRRRRRRRRPERRRV